MSLLKRPNTGRQSLSRPIQEFGQSQDEVANEVSCGGEYEPWRLEQPNSENAVEPPGFQEHQDSAGNKDAEKIHDAQKEVSRFEVHRLFSCVVRRA